MKLDLVTGSVILQNETKKDVIPFGPKALFFAFSLVASVGTFATMGYFYATSDYHSGNDAQPTLTENAPTSAPTFE